MAPGPVGLRAPAHHPHQAGAATALAAAAHTCAAGVALFNHLTIMRVFPGRARCAGGTAAATRPWQAVFARRMHFPVEMLLTVNRTCNTIAGLHFGGVPEWSKGSDCKSDGSAFGGSNPPPSTIYIRGVGGPDGVEVSKRGCSSMVEPQPSKLMMWVRFPSPAPDPQRVRS